MKKIRIVITGATGYVGQHLVPLLCDLNFDIMTLNRDVLKAMHLFSNSSIHHAAIDNMEQEMLGFNPQVVIHLATLSTSRSDKSVIQPMLEANLHFGIKLLDILQKCSAFSFFINLGSFAEFRTNTEEFKDAYLYTATKSAFRHFVDYYCDLNNWKYCTVVPYTIYGENDTAKKIVDYVIDSIDSQCAVDMTKGEQCLDFIHISDVAQFFVALLSQFDNLKCMPQGLSLPLGTGISTSILDLAKIVSKLTDKQCNINWGARSYRPLDVMMARADILHTQLYVDWQPKVALIDGLKERIDWHLIHSNN